jgi:transcriptional regulator with GAF, ATPase, and Fis domain
MASLYVIRPGQLRTRGYQVYKRISTLGPNPDDDLVLVEPAFGSARLSLVHDGRSWTLESSERGLEFVADGKKRRSHTLNDGDVVRVGDTLLVFSLADFSAADDDDEPHDQGFERLAKLSDLAVRLMAEPRLDTALQLLVDHLVEALNADKGFLILTHTDQPWVRVARNVAGDDLPDRETIYSDSILKAVLETGEPVVISDALRDTRFSNATSVMRLKLSSVMAAPMAFKGRTLGLLYVGNDNVISLFTKHDLEILRLFASQAAGIVHNALVMGELQARVDDLTERVDASRFGDLIGSCPGMQRVYRRVEKVAPTDASVLVQGETGSGKELIAREIHRRSARARGPFVAINCGAIPENLLESELFGHVRGAFTGAVNNTPGKFQLANGGTLFLDEIGELPLNLQVKLLRALQEKQVQRVGAPRPEAVDLRVVAATNKNLADEVQAGAFREDLYYRLNVILVALPPLRERGDDIVLLANYLLKRFAGEFGSKVRGFSAEAQQALRKHPWPGNIRELENRLKRAAIFADGPLVTPTDLEIDDAGVPSVQPLASIRETFQMAYVLRVLELNGGNRTKTAHDLDVDPRTIFRYLEREREIGAPDLSWMRFFK